MLQKFLNFFKKEQPIVVVSGLPRSGTSMMMSMIEAGGIPPLTDNIRVADSENPKGYFEHERVKKMKDGDVEWLAEAQGNVIKVIAGLLPELPKGFTYKVLFMNRAMPEILASQKAMLIRRGEDPDKIDDKAMGSLYHKHLLDIKQWVSRQDNIASLDVDYNLMLENLDPQIDRINQFLGGNLDMERMAAVIDRQLYRQRSTNSSL